MQQPVHVVIVPDGNRRWAKNNGLLPQQGHIEGAKISTAILEKALELNIPHLTLWGSSVSNLTNRTKLEIEVLCQVFSEWFEKLLNHPKIHERKVKVDILGRWRDLLPKSLTQLFENIIEKTQDRTGPRLTFLMGYDGRDEMVDAAKKIAQSAQLNPEGFEISYETIKQNLWTHDLPPVDLVIRTGGEPHWSAGLMMWDVAEAQLHFTPTLWPAFTPEEFEKIIEETRSHERRLGK